MYLELENQYTKKLKITLQFKIVLFLLICLIYSLIYNVNYKSKYSDEKVIYGYVINYYVDIDKTIIYLKGKEKIICNYYGKLDVNLGDYIMLEGTLELPNENTIFNLFNYRKYLKYEHINYIFNVVNITKIKDNDNLLYKIKNNIIKRIDKSENKEYLHTFILGNTKYIDDSVIESYRTNGISHLFAISGMHISLFSLLILKIFKKYKYKDILVLLIILFYMFLTFSPSILRAGILFILLFIKKEFKLNINNTNLMIILLGICILFDPFIIYKIGFQYSYIVSFSLIIFNDTINRQNKEIKKLLYISLISFIVSFPITINNFYQVNFLSILLNILFVPFVSIILFPLTLISFIIPINIQLIINIFEYISLSLSKINLFIVIFPKINIVFVLIYYLIIFYTLYNINKKDYKKIIILIILILLHKFSPYLNINTKVIFIDVSQGDSALISLPNNKSNVLIDTGGIVYSKSYYISENIITYLKSIGITKLDYLILSHGDYDHMGEAINLVEKFKVEKVIFNCGPYNDLENELIKVLDKKKIKYYSCIKELNIDKNKLYFLQTKEYYNENDNSNVIYTELDGYKFMFMGDASSVTEKEILDKYNLPNIDVLKVGHHGSKTSSSEEFIDEINPKYSIISVGKNNRYGHPNKETLNNLENSKIYRTDIDGSIMFKIKNNKLKIETCSP